MDPRRASAFIVVIDPGWGKTKLEETFTSYQDALRACFEHKQSNPNAKYWLIWGQDEEAVKSAYAQLLRGGQVRTESMEQEISRYKLEEGLGGDHDLLYEFELPIEMVVRVAWTKLAARVQRGEIGGMNDGKESGDEGGWAA